MSKQVKRKQVTVRIEVNLLEKAKEYAASKGLSISEFISVAISEYMDQKRTINIVEELLNKLKAMNKEGD